MRTLGIDPGTVNLGYCVVQDGFFLSCGVAKLEKNEPLEEELPTEVVRNYVIFDEIPFDHFEITKVTVGRQYDSPDSEYSSAWCYINRNSSNGLRDTLFLKQIDEDGIDKLDVTDQVASDFLLSKDVILEAQSKCTI